MLVLERRGDDEWKVVEPSRGPAKELKVSGVLLALKALRWKEIVSEKGEDAARYGLDKPELEVTLPRPAVPSWARSSSASDEEV